ncbi:hypothetical protein JR316_0010992 [Psilocybe cubensis]|uniref:Uncharacterized protein n=2 Tax=Psilocybe cubensis TaxID=181762 RepID=A0A8H7XNZ2_PSICU|nr:hypothetical protein JR316_0010992 [Psilocybe cubensis]KAH9477076.1 hypothetical protein JR316_0010992 [Psilocybe cubensis]
MPGPSNNRKKTKAKSKNLKKQTTSQKKCPDISERVDDLPLDTEPSNQSSAPSSPSPPVLRTPSPPLLDPISEKGCSVPHNYVPRTADQIEQILFQEPFIHDPGNGPRVRDARAFMASFFAQPPALNDPLCAEFAQDEVLQMLCTVLPEEAALLLWYNKSRSESRVCPACQRLYRIGDTLPELMPVEEDQVPVDRTPSPKLLREQRISGLCSPVCFIMASFNFPGAIKSAWGRMADEMDDEAWNLLNGPGENSTQNDVSHSLGMIVKMTRLYDLGLAQLCFDTDEAALLQAAAELDLGVNVIGA